MCSLQIQKILGKGSYGTAYRAKRHSDGKLYAIKVCVPAVYKEVVIRVEIACLPRHGVTPGASVGKVSKRAGGGHPEDVGC